MENTGYKIKLGCKKSVYDKRDLKYNIPLLKITLPSYCDLQNKIRQVFQQEYNDCVANACSNIITSLDEQNNKIDTVSRLFIYYNARCMENIGSEYVDEGTTIRDCMKALTKFNFIDEKIYEYVDKNVLRPPIYEIYEKASKNPYHINYYRSVLNNEYNLKYILSQAKLCIIFGAMLFESFTNLDYNFVCPIPNPNKEKFIGGHAMLIIGYLDLLQSFKILNSWGKNWGNHGIHYMPYNYICSDLCQDLWCVDKLDKDYI